MAVIAMTREMGSLGKDVAAELAREIGLRLVYHEIVDNLAQKMRLPESAVLRFVQGRAGLVERWQSDMDRLSLYTAEEVLELALAGNLVIRGWGATCLLRPVSHVLCVRVCAPFDLRAQRIRERVGFERLEQAAEEVRRSDRAHADTMRRRFGIDWRDPAGYDLVLNTERVPVGDCVQQIRRLVESPGYRPTPGSRARLRELCAAARSAAARMRERTAAGSRWQRLAPRSLFR